MSDKPQDKPKAAPQLAPGKENMNGIEYVSTRHDAKIPVGVTLQDVLAPAFWAHHAMQLRPMDEIRARAEDGTWMAYLIVLDSSRTWAKVQLLSEHKLSTRDVSLSHASDKAVQDLIKAHKIIHRGPRKWSVVRESDDAVIHQDEQTRPAAEAWLDAYARVEVSGDPALADSVRKQTAKV